MSLSMYDASIPVFIRQFSNLSLILEKAVTYAETKKFEPAILVNARLAPDMFPYYLVKFKLRAMLPKGVLRV